MGMEKLEGKRRKQNSVGRGDDGGDGVGGGGRGNRFTFPRIKFKKIENKEDAGKRRELNLDEMVPMVELAVEREKWIQLHQD